MSGRTILVTGAASGIGLAVSAAFVAEGDVVISLDQTDCPLAATSVQGDVRDPLAHQSAVEAAQRTGRLDVLIANAGVHDGGLGLDAKPQDLADRMRQVLDVDVVGYALAIQAAAPALASSRGAVVMTLSDAAFLAGTTGAGLAYTAAKHACVGLLRWAAHALAPDVTVNGVAPGGVVTGLRVAGGGTVTTGDPEAKRRAIASGNPLGVTLEAEELAGLYVFLASRAARAMTGEILRPDGGLSLR